MKGKISEIFESMQGEGIYVGQKQIFVRFFDCNLNCSFCDTKPDRYTEFEPKELLVVLQCYKGKYHSVAFTGGEPLLQKDFLKEALMLSREAGFKNYLETNGTLPEALEEVIEFVDIVAMDLKLPSSTKAAHYWDAHEKFLKIASRKEVFLKIVVCQATREDDLKDALEIIIETNPYVVLVLQPNSSEYDQELEKKMMNFRNICVEAEVTACVIPQIHKIVGIR